MPPGIKRRNNLQRQGFSIRAMVLQLNERYKERGLCIRATALQLRRDLREAGLVSGHDFTGCGKTWSGGRRGFNPRIKPTGLKSTSAAEGCFSPMPHPSRTLRRVVGTTFRVPTRNLIPSFPQSQHRDLPTTSPESNRSRSRLRSFPATPIVPAKTNDLYFACNSLAVRTAIFALVSRWTAARSIRAFL